MKRRLMVLLAVLLLMVACQAPAANSASPTAENSAENYPFTFTDEAGQEITIESEPSRIVSLAPSMTEDVYALGLFDKLVGRTDYCEFPQQVSSIESVGSIIEPDVEKVLSLKPDVVLVASFFKDEFLNKIREAGIKVVIFEDASTVEVIYHQLSLMGKIFNKQREAQALIDGMKERLQAISDKVKGKEPVSVYYCVGYGEGDYAATGETFINDMIKIAGGKNIAESSTGWSYNRESLLKEDPRYIVMSNEFDMKKNFMADEKYAALSAVKEDRVVEVDTDIIQIQGPRIVEGVEALARILHPESFKE